MFVQAGALVINTEHISAITFNPATDSAQIHTLSAVVHTVSRAVGIELVKKLQEVSENEN